MSETPAKKIGRPVTTGTAPKRGIRVGDTTWDAIQAATAEQNSNPSELTKAFYAWYLRVPGAQLPKRPPA